MLYILITLLYNKITKLSYKIDQTKIVYFGTGEYYFIGSFFFRHLLRHPSLFICYCMLCRNVDWGSIYDLSTNYVVLESKAVNTLSYHILVYDDTFQQYFPCAYTNLHV